MVCPFPAHNRDSGYEGKAVTHLVSIPISLLVLPPSRHASAVLLLV